MADDSLLASRSENFKYARARPDGRVDQSEGAHGQLGQRADGDTQRGQVRGQDTSDLAGPEHDVQPILTHDQILSLILEQPWRPSAAQSRCLSPTLR
jgi:hypothetical protein